MKTIIHVITGLGVGGAERALHSLLTGGLNNKFNNRVISLTDVGHFGPLLEDCYVPVETLNIRLKGFSLKPYLSLYRLINKHQPDILQGWMYHGSLAVTFASILSTKKIPVLWNIRQSLDDPGAKVRSSWIICWILPMLSYISKAIIYNSFRSAVQHVALGYSSSTTRVIPNGFDCEKWKPDVEIGLRLRESLGISSEKRVFGFVGRGHVSKGLSALINSFSNVYLQNKNIALVCVGGDLIDAVHFSENLPIYFVDHQDNVNQWMSVFDILCLPSLWEGFPNVVGEAMSCETPCLVTDVGDCALLVGDTGWVLPKNNQKSLEYLLNEIANISSDQIERKGKAARQRILENYTLAQMVKCYGDLYSSIIKT